MPFGELSTKKKSHPSLFLLAGMSMKRILFFISNVNGYPPTSQGLAGTISRSCDKISPKLPRLAQGI